MGESHNSGESGECDHSGELLYSGAFADYSDPDEIADLYASVGSGKSGDLGESADSGESGDSGETDDSGGSGCFFVNLVILITWLILLNLIIW